MVEREHRRAETEHVWRKSSASGADNCHEIAFSDRTVFVRDSKNRSDVALRFDRDEWADFLRMISR
jgi:hypothetical protein